ATPKSLKNRPSTQVSCSAKPPSACSGVVPLTLPSGQFTVSRVQEAPLPHDADRREPFAPPRRWRRALPPATAQPCAELAPGSPAGISALLLPAREYPAAGTSSPALPGIPAPLCSVHAAVVPPWRG